MPGTAQVARWQNDRSRVYGTKRKVSISHVLLLPRIESPIPPTPCLERLSLPVGAEIEAFQRPGVVPTISQTSSLSVSEPPALKPDAASAWSVSSGAPWPPPPPAAAPTPPCRWASAASSNG
jgi:hypothetical protein